MKYAAIYIAAVFCYPILIALSHADWYARVRAELTDGTFSDYSACVPIEYRSEVFVHVHDSYTVHSSSKNLHVPL